MKKKTKRGTKLKRGNNLRSEVERYSRKVTEKEVGKRERGEEKIC